MRVNTKFTLIALSLLSAVLVGFGIHTNAASVDRGRDCDNFAIIRCGTKTAAELRTEYDSLNTSKSNGSTKRQADIPKIFSAFGIKRADLNGTFAKGVVYKNGTVKLDNGKTVAKNAQVGMRNARTGTTIAGTNAKITPASSMASAQEALIKLNKDGQFVFAVMTPCGNPVKATNTVPKPKPKPTYSCDMLTAKADSKNQFKYTFTVKGSAKNGAKITGYTINYGDGTKTATSTKNTFTHIYKKAGTYTVKASVRVQVDKSTKTVTNKTCETKVTIKEPEKPKPKPAYACESLTASPQKVQIGEKVDFTTAVKAENGATVKDYAFDFGDGNKQTSKDKSISHTYEKPGSYTAKVVPSFTVNGKTETSVSDKCQTTVTVESNPGVKIEKTVNSVEHIVTDVNKPYTYEITVKNTGNVDLENVKVTDQAPEGVQFDGADRGEINDGLWSYTVPSLKKGGSESFKINAQVVKEIEGKIVNTACVDAPAIPGDKDDCDDATVEITVEACNIETGVIERVNPGQQNTETHTTDLSKCDDVQVCDITTKTIVTVTKEESQDTERYAGVDSPLCQEEKPAEAPKEETPAAPAAPAELPRTGATDAILGSFGLAALVTASLAYAGSRRSL